MHADLFADGSYLPLRVAGKQAVHVCAFARRHGTDLAVTVATRLHRSFLEPDSDTLRIPVQVWEDTVVELPRRCRPRQMVNILDGCAAVPLEQDGKFTLRVADLLGNFPVALLAAKVPTDTPL